jgi:hypothetical protein
MTARSPSVPFARVSTAARRPDPSRSILAMDETLFKPTNGAYPAAGAG